MECDAATLNSLFTACHIAMAWRQALSLYRMGEETYEAWLTRGFRSIFGLDLTLKSMNMRTFVHIFSLETQMETALFADALAPKPVESLGNVQIWASRSLSSPCLRRYPSLDLGT